MSTEAEALVNSDDSPHPAPDPRHLRNTLGRFVTGVTVVTYLLDGQPRGLTVNSFTPVSMSPPLILVSISRKARAMDGLIDAPFVVNVLASEQLPLALQFAGQQQDDIDVAWSSSPTVPRLQGSVAWVACDPHSQVEVGDHVLVVGRVVDHFSTPNEPLLFASGSFKLLGGAVDAFDGSAAR
ncbi:flavin reductase domain-containing protein [Mycolicibacterium aurum]|uniref:Flavin reductase domain-containing protein n=1 Tax=Mycolicibacterium aurum TaxID=1791 RepID=A0A448IJQ5_MYCAU|nr:flavin reductase family protein [Mycolicibacterium aurum]VEG52640.1 flavin reductase domain-containing protein [Mycolicibacterium aurum]